MSRRFVLRSSNTKRENIGSPDALFYGGLIQKERKYTIPRRFVLRSSITKRENIECPDALFYGALSQREKT
jgi:hypothetical protein